jgi:hypothetical protein
VINARAEIQARLSLKYPGYGVVLSDMKYSARGELTLGDPVMDPSTVQDAIDRYYINNCTDQDRPAVFKVSVTIHRSRTYRLTSSVQTETDVSLQIPISKLVVGVGEKTTINSSREESLGEGKDDTREYDVNQTAAKHSTFYASASRRHYVASQAFSGLVEVNGNVTLYPQVIVLGAVFRPRPIDSILTPAERTFNVAGQIDGVEVSDITMNYIDQPLDPKSDACKFPSDGVHHEGFSLHVSSLRTP